MNLDAGLLCTPLKSTPGELLYLLGEAAIYNHNPSVPVVDCSTLIILPTLDHCGGYVTCITPTCVLWLDQTVTTKQSVIDRA